MQNITNIVKSLVVAVLLAALVSQVAIAEASAQEADELIMYPTNIDNCFVVDVQAEADENGGDLSDGDLTLRNELFELGWFSLAGDEQEYLYSSGCSESPLFVSGLPDEARFDFASQWKLPEPSEGYTWAEDLTQVPNSFYSNSSGGESPSTSTSASEAKKATVTSDTVKEAPKASDSSAMKKAKELAAKAKSTAKSKPSKAKNTSESKSPSKSSESSKSCKAEDGSTIENCKDYYSPAPKTSDDGWLVLVMDKGTTNKCSVFTNDRAEADSIASEYKASGKGAAVVHYTKSLAAKSPTC